MDFSGLKAALAHRKGIRLADVERAYAFAAKAHEGQKRKTGEDYITHPLSVAKRLADLGADEDTIVSAILHDTIEDSAEINAAEIRNLFGPAVATLVEGMTKFEKHTFDGQDGMDEKIETIRKWLTVLQKDLRIAIIKLCDRLDNLETLHVFENPQKRKRIAEETLDVYSKIAEWLSLYAIKYRLEEMALPYAMEEESYLQLCKEQEVHQEVSEKFSRKIKKTYLREQPEGKAYFKPLTITPLRLSLDPNLPYEIICVMPSESECYQMLSFFHGHWRRKHGSFSDFINTPKINGYRALHTTLIADDKEVTVRIMTEEMFDYSQNGVLTCCFSAEKCPVLPWIEKLSELMLTNREKSLEFWRGLHDDLFEGFIPIHGPQGKTVSLPSRSTYLDAAFAFLKEDAIYVEKILAHGEEIPIRRKITEGEKLDFVLSEESQVEYDWLEAVDNVVSIRMIKEALREQNDAEKIEKGRQLLQDEFDKYDLGFVDEIKEQELLVACQDLEVTSLDDLLIKIGEIFIFPSEVTVRLISEKAAKANNENGKTDYVIQCEVRRDRFSTFFELAHDYFSKANIRLQENRQRTFNVKLGVSASKEKVMDLVMKIRREPGMRTVGIEKRIDMPLVALFVTCILFLWGVEPVIVYEAYRQEHLLPADVLLLRSLIIAIPLLLWSLLNIQKVKPKPLPLLNKLIIAGSLGIFMMLYFRYNLLLDTIPSNYMVMYRNHAFLVILYFLPFALFKTKPFLTAVFLACLIVGNLLLLLLTPQWPWEYKIFNILAFIGLAIYSITSQIFAENYHVKIRYFRFIGIIYLYSSFFAAINYFSTVENPFARIVSLLDNHIFLLGFLSIAAVAPHYLVYHLNLKYRNSLYTQIPTALTWIVTIGMEMWILKLPFNYIAFVSGILITAGIIILLWIKRSKERLDVPF